MKTRLCQPYAGALNSLLVMLLLALFILPVKATADVPPVPDSEVMLQVDAANSSTSVSETQDFSSLLNHLTDPSEVDANDMMGEPLQRAYMNEKDTEDSFLHVAWLRIPLGILVVASILLIGYGVAGMIQIWVTIRIKRERGD